MRELFKKYKSVLRFVVLFLGTYLLLTVLYSLYLKFSNGKTYFPDYLTHLVAEQSGQLLEGFGYRSSLHQDSVDQGMLLTIRNSYTVNIVEGCNSVSVIILFAAFIIAFAEKARKTTIFLLAGAVLIYAVNLLRIVLLIIALYRYPQYQGILHSVVFPGIIYGLVFLLWILWVKILDSKASA